MTNLIDSLRKFSVEDILNTPSVETAWPTWKQSINQKLAKGRTASYVLDLADNLSSIFKETSKSGRGQSTLKRGGVAWEGMVAWYLNLCLLGSRTVVFKNKKKFIPNPVRDAITVQYGTSNSNSESDLLAITFPDRNEYTSDPAELKLSKAEKKRMDCLAEKYFSDYEVGIIQCKTNWNDNAQTPMLWDMVYQSRGFVARNISVGKNGYSITGLKKFTYSFVTVPSSRKDIRGPSCTPVKRVSSISGGNYWGMPSESGIANSLKEIFSKNFSGGATHTIRQDLSEELPRLDSEYSYFGL